ncbi:hypothetical protein RSO01_04830 [Reyranella soli]|uniref:Uncharacterized protein n=1 Tax=Reyranella soli TaxID=1230389 RepID=A0A512N2U4_9HYPH|nr:hypothetical protein RSO01_04830 [Reyranella soli]
MGRQADCAEVRTKGAVRSRRGRGIKGRTEIISATTAGEDAQATYARSQGTFVFLNKQPFEFQDELRHDVDQERCSHS